MFTAAPFTTAMITWKQRQVPIKEQLGLEDMRYTHVAHALEY